METFDPAANLDAWYASIDESLKKHKYYNCAVHPKVVDQVKELTFRYEETRGIYLVKDLRGGVLRLYDPKITLPELKETGRLDHWIDDWTNAIEQDEALVGKYKNHPLAAAKIVEVRERIAKHQKEKGEMEAMRDIELS